jgi:hypothetical protein
VLSKSGGARLNIKKRFHAFAHCHREDEGDTEDVERRQQKQPGLVGICRSGWIGPGRRACETQIQDED